MKEKETLLDRLTKPFLLIIKNEEDFAEKRTYRFNAAKMVVFTTLFLMVLLFLAVLLVNTILSRWYDPRYAQREAMKNIIMLATKVDSLEMKVKEKDTFIESFKKMLTGGEAYNDSVSDTTLLLDKNKIAIDELSPIDSQIRKEFESAYDLTFSGSTKNTELLGMYFFKPIEGIVSSEFDLEIDHFGIDVVAKLDEPVKSIADGTVIQADWTGRYGHVLTVQHDNNLLSVYKHNAVLLKKVGDFIEAGEIIAIIGNSGEITTGPHLHFEMWHKGKPVNPLDYINL